MTIYSPENAQGLLGIVAALRSGLDPSTAYSLIQDIEGRQAAQVARNQERLGGLADMIQNAAVNGMTYDQASQLVAAQPGPVGPAATNMLNTAFGVSGQPVAPGSSEAVSLRQGGQLPGYQSSLAGPNQPVQAGQATSPLAYSTPESQAQQLQLASAQQSMLQGQVDAATEADWSAFTADAMKAKASGMSVDDFKARVFSNPQAAQFVSADAGRADTILKTVFGAAAVAASGLG